MRIKRRSRIAKNEPAAAQSTNVLLAAAFFILVCGMGTLVVNSATPETADYILTWLPWLVALCLAASFVQFVLVHVKSRPNLLLFPLAMTAVAVGLVMIARLNPPLVLPQIRWLLIGMAVLLVALRLNRRLGRLPGNYQYVWGLLCLVVLLTAIIFGTEIGGSRNWLVIGSFRVQPSEFAKLLLVLFLASFLADHRSLLTENKRRRVPPLRFIAPLIVVWSMAVLMFVIQRDLGAALLFFSLAVTMTYMATQNKAYLLAAFAFFLPAAGVSYLLFSHVARRFDIWLDPWQDPTGAAYQIVQSLFAFGAGGVWGRGLGDGAPLLIPEVHTDFIYAAIAEELGLIGGLVIIALYAVLFFEGIKIALAADNDGKMLLAAGLSAMFFFQSFFIIAGVSKFLPLTGITLPFISYGGSSMVASFATLGVLLSLSRGK